MVTAVGQRNLAPSDLNFDAAPRLDAATGVLLVGHGTREVQGVEQFFRLADRVRQLLPGVPVDPCFLELAEPTIAAAVARIAATGIHRLIVSPVLLFSAGHIQRDIPQAVQAAVAALPNFRPAIRQAEHLGCHPRILELSARRFCEAVAKLTPSTDAGAAVGLAMIGRGSLDAEATAEMQRFLALRCQQTPVAAHWLGFMAMAQPTAATALSSAAASPLSYIVVQPHLLFAGELLAQLRQQVAVCAATNDHQQWIVAEPLGPDVQLAQAIVDGIALSR